MASHKFENFSELQTYYELETKLYEKLSESTDTGMMPAGRFKKYMYIITYDLSGKHSRKNVYKSLWKVIDTLVSHSYQMSKSCYFVLTNIQCSSDFINDIHQIFTFLDGDVISVSEITDNSKVERY